MYRKIVNNGKVIGFERISEDQATTTTIGWYARRLRDRVPVPA